MPWWGALVLTVVAHVTLTVTVSVAGLVRAAAHGVSMEEAVERVAADPLNLGAVQGAAFGTALFAGLVVFQRGIPMRRALALRPIRPATVVLALVAGLALQFPLAEVGNVAREVFPIPVEEQLRQRRLVTPDGLADALVTILAIVVIAPASEELLFRGLMLRPLAERYGPGFALGLTSVLFGLVHGQPVAVAYATVAGVVLGTVAVRTGGVAAPLVVHAAVNAAPLLFSERVVRIRGFNTLGEQVCHLPLPLLVGTSVVAAAALAAMARLEEAEI